MGLMLMGRGGVFVRNVGGGASAGGSRGDCGHSRIDKRCNESFQDCVQPNGGEEAELKAE